MGSSYGRKLKKSHAPEVTQCLHTVKHFGISIVIGRGKLTFLYSPGFISGFFPPEAITDIWEDRDHDGMH